MATVYYLFLYLFVFGKDQVFGSRTKPVTIALKSKWNSSSLLGEISEYLADEGEDLFWLFAEETLGFHWMHPSDKDKYTAAMEFASRMVPPLQYRLLKAALSLREKSAKVEMYQQMALTTMVAPSSECSSFIEWVGGVNCTSDKLKRQLSDHFSEKQSSQSDHKQPLVYSFDHVYQVMSQLPADLAQPPALVYYGQLGSADFSDYHKMLKELAENGNITYLFRHYQVQKEVNPRLTGYGIRLDIKSTEYKAVDDRQIHSEGNKSQDIDAVDEVDGFRFGRLKELYPDLLDQLNEFKTFLKEGNQIMSPLKQWQLQDLGMQAAQRVMSSPKDLQLHTLTDLAQNAPLLSRSLSRTRVSKDLKQEIKRNQKVLSEYGITPETSILLINGIVLQSHESNAFNVLNILKREARVLQSLIDINILRKDIMDLLTLDVQGSEKNEYLIDMRHEHVVFANDIETDKPYSKWSKNVKDILKPTFPGMLRQIRKNFFNLVMCIDPLDPDTTQILQHIVLYIKHTVPIRFGFVLVDNGKGDQVVKNQLIRGFYYVYQQSNARKAFEYLVKVRADGKEVTSDILEDALDAVEVNVSHDVFADDTPQDELRKEMAEFFRYKGMGAAPQIVLNGQQVNIEDDFETSLSMVLQSQTPIIQQDVYKSKLTNDMDCYDYLMNKPNVLNRFNSHIIATNPLQVDLSMKADIVTDSTHWDRVRELTERELTTKIFTNLLYLKDMDFEQMRPLSYWLIVDLTTEVGLTILKNAVSYLNDTLNTRLAVIHNPHTIKPHPLTFAYQEAVDSKEPFSSVQQLLEDIDKIQATQADKNSGHIAVIKAHQMFCKKILKLKPGQNSILSNGRLIGPFEEGEEFTYEDFSTLELFELSNHGNKIFMKVQDLAVEMMNPDWDTAPFRSDLQLKVASLLRSLPKQRRIELPDVAQDHSVINIKPEDAAATVQVSAYVNPLSVAAQKIAPMLQVFSKVIPMDMTVILNPKDKLSEIPLKSFYRYVLEPELQFTGQGELAAGPEAVFANLPEEPLYTLNPDVLHAWMVAAVSTKHDLDNIHLASVTTGIHADFELEHILVEGHCSDIKTSSPTPGLQFILGTDQDPEHFDTIVMANLGYYQLKANPGLWQMQLRYGRSAGIYHIIKHTAVADPVSSERVLVNVDDLLGKFVVIFVGRRPGMEREDLLSDGSSQEEEAEEEGGLWSRLFGSSSQPSKSHKMADNDTIHIFSLASGHLYERFLRIMVLSVIKRTESKVKFWFLKNYLSPSFKEFMPYYAKEYGFEYEYVQYKWPMWLHGQTEKQRLIWGYKILFLDVLFPLYVKKIIFVDADQVVYTDMKELVELPLGGAPYGYTPFCDSRPEMNGFRFWNSGYWKNHLGNRKYHISALYVVDLRRFRQLAAGDRLRGQYQALSQDPNSLANLDQDLPNNMIHQVPIKSLPQEWLWCETWCSDESKAQAKTIDLCNNPLTKEPKLKSAMRIIPEWVDYDEEIRSLQLRVAEELHNIPTDLPPIDTRSSGSFFISEENDVEQVQDSDSSHKDKHKEL